METKFNQPVEKKKRRLRLRPGWQERLPIRPLLLIAGFAVILTLLILVNQPRSRVLNSAEMEMVRSGGILRIGVDENLYGLCQNGKGLETDIGDAIGEAVFQSTDSITYVPCTRYSALWRMDDGYIDLAILSMQTFNNSNYARNQVPFYVDDCVLLGYLEQPVEKLKIAVLDGTESEKILQKYAESYSEMTVVPCADYYTMMVKMRAGSVDASCLSRCAAMTYREQGMVIFANPIGTIPYYAIAKDGSILLELCDELFTGWKEDGTLQEWGTARGLN
ncbi:MAG: hypothetical protein IKD62_07345 [Oscillospiraceae bacterium]|nr:hypothetical protein [Oscillospiraceae bacterium]